MALNEWNVQKKLNIDEDCFCISGDNINVKISGEKYSYVKFTKTISDIKGECFYKFDIDAEAKNVDYKIVFTCLDTDGNQLSRGYLEEGFRLVTPEGAVKIELGVIVFSEICGSFLLNKLDISFESEYTKRPAKLCSVCIDYGVYGSHRTCEMNMEATMKVIKEAVKEKPDMIVLTETFYNRRVMEDAEKLALPLNSEPINILSKTAKENNCYIAFSFALIDEKGYYRNAGIIIDRNGAIVHEYNKCHITLGECEKGMLRGNEISVYDTDFGRVGFAICWDLFFPEHVRTLRKKGVEVIINPTAGFSEFRVCERARENGVYIVTSAVDERHMTRITSPLGELLATAEDKNYAIAEVDLNKPYYTYWLSCPSNTTSRNIYINEMREDLYSKEV